MKHKLSKRAKILMGVLIPAGVIVLAIGGIAIASLVKKPGSGPSGSNLKDYDFEKNLGKIYFDYQSSHEVTSGELTDKFKMHNNTFDWMNNEFDWMWTDVNVLGSAKLKLVASSTTQYYKGESKVMNISWTPGELASDCVPLEYMIIENNSFKGLRDDIFLPSANYTTLYICNVSSVKEVENTPTVKWFQPTGGMSLTKIELSDEVDTIEDAFSDSQYITLQEVNLNNCAILEHDCFKYCAALAKLTLGHNKNLSLSNGAFQECPKLERIIGDFDGEPYSTTSSAAFTGAGNAAPTRQITNSNSAYTAANLATYLKNLYSGLSNFVAA